jgi:hypothetical protein
MVDRTRAASDLDSVLDPGVNVATGSNNRLEKVEAESKVTRESSCMIVSTLSNDA